MCSVPCLVGIATAEFKYDATDGLYKLMEVNLRNPMSGGLGRCSGVDLAAAQYLDPWARRFRSRRR